ncbi:hypothetical protein B0H11DRAFT_989205 [Mycena galericulata]|nr:hypothetical protein B0H11DRAFT_989205 [Mycena galericulata]
MLTGEMTEDVPIKVMRPVERTVVLKKGTLMVVEMIAVHHNPHFTEPDEYPGMRPRIRVGDERQTRKRQ